MNKETISRVLQFLRLTDEQGNLSLTNLAVVAALYNIATNTAIETSDLLMFVASIAGYQIKRFSGAPTAQTKEEIEFLNEQIKQMETKITALQVGKLLKK
jgi:hypothetical protein